MSDKVMSVKEFIEWEREFFEKRKGHYRLGQAFLNDYGSGSDPLLYYQNDDIKARQMIYDTYLSEE